MCWQIKGNIFLIKNIIQINYILILINYTKTGKDVDLEYLLK